jgi:hypothetical protein
VTTPSNLEEPASAFSSEVDAGSREENALFLNKSGRVFLIGIGKRYRLARMQA